MISQQGRVVAIRGNDAVVNIGGVSGCPACDAGKGCGAGIFGRLLRDQKIDIQVKNDIGATNGQNVSLGIPEHRFLSLVFRLYVWPLVAGLVGVIAGFLITSKIGAGGIVPDMVGLVMGLSAAGFALRYSRRKLREFPFVAEVHLLKAVDENMDSSCVSRESGKQTRTVNYDLE